MNVSKSLNRDDKNPTPLQILTDLQTLARFL